MAKNAQLHGFGMRGTSAGVSHILLWKPSSGSKDVSGIMGENGLSDGAFDDMGLHSVVSALLPS